MVSAGGQVFADAGQHRFGTRRDDRRDQLVAAAARHVIVPEPEPAQVADVVRQLQVVLGVRAAGGLPRAAPGERHGLLRDQQGCRPEDRPRERRMGGRAEIRVRPEGAIPGQFEHLRPERRQDDRRPSRRQLAEELPHLRQGPDVGLARRLDQRRVAHAEPENETAPYRPASSSALAASAAGGHVHTLAIPVATTSRPVADSSGSSASKSAAAFTPGIQTEPNPASRSRGRRRRVEADARRRRHPDPGPPEGRRSSSVVGMIFL